MTVITDASGLDLSCFLRPGDRIVMGQACGEPTTLVETLIVQGKDIGGLSVFIATSFSGLLDPRAADSFAISSMGAIGALRSLTAAHKLSVIPCHVSQIGPMIEAGIIGCDVAFVQLSPPDENGNHSFGLVSDHVQAAVRKARVVIAEINEQVPFTFGELLPASRIDCAVHVSRMPVQVSPAKTGETDDAIARHVAAYIGDGSVLQTGVSINGALIGTRRLYEFAHRNPRIRMCSTAYTHDAAVLARLERLVTINSALEVDLTGQVNAEQSGSAYMGGTGGQADFVRAGSRSPGGHSIIALPATARGGKLSRITAGLSGPVTTARSDVDVIVTEFGAAELEGQTLAERTRRLIAIAHPDFRDELRRAARTIQQRGF